MILSTCTPSPAFVGTPKPSTEDQTVTVPADWLMKGDSFDFEPAVFEPEMAEDFGEKCKATASFSPTSVIGEVEHGRSRPSSIRERRQARSSSHNRVCLASSAKAVERSSHSRIRSPKKSSGKTRASPEPSNKTKTIFPSNPPRMRGMPAPADLEDTATSTTKCKGGSKGMSKTRSRSATDLTARRASSMTNLYSEALSKLADPTMEKARSVRNLSDGSYEASPKNSAASSNRRASASALTSNGKLKKVSSARKVCKKSEASLHKATSAQTLANATWNAKPKRTSLSPRMNVVKSSSEVDLQKGASNDTWKVKPKKRSTGRNHAEPRLQKAMSAKNMTALYHCEDKPKKSPSTVRDVAAYPSEANIQEARNAREDLKKASSERNVAMAGRGLPTRMRVKRATTVGSRSIKAAGGRRRNPIPEKKTKNDTQPAPSKSSTEPMPSTQANLPSRRRGRRQSRCSLRLQKQSSVRQVQQLLQLSPIGDDSDLEPDLEFYEDEEQDVQNQEWNEKRAYRQRDVLAKLRGGDTEEEETITTEEGPLEEGEPIQEQQPDPDLKPESTEGGSPGKRRKNRGRSSIVQTIGEATLCQTPAIEGPRFSLPAAKSVNYGAIDNFDASHADLAWADDRV